MDQHTPPPAPAILSKEERRSEESGYIRPLREEFDGYNIELVFLGVISD